MKVFREANGLVADLCPRDASGQFVDPLASPMTTLCIVAQTLTEGVIAAWAGDSIAFEVVDIGRGESRSRSLGWPHAGPGGGLASCLAAVTPHRIFNAAGARGFTIETIPPRDTSMPHAFVATTDGVWVRTLVVQEQATILSDLDWANLFGAACQKSKNAAEVADAVLRNAKACELNDNAAVAAVFIDSVATSDQADLGLLPAK